ncbi:YIP1 family protein [Sinisalibacter lacisalsi]|uniref:YIP1 family protein n=1 Tax=Sinisalibacter lacisalsi TaxID=1526570 RepID=A0ABQ1QLL5_9RHOB|nr:YIP1 family protein [Sinisalibacter lacisalsi]GGD31822.1 YIP1 family protein [Sinisalibacter lacisalsi]
MKLEWGYLFGMALQTVPEPRKVARDVQNLDLSRAVLWQILALILVVTTILGVIASVLFPTDPEAFGGLFANPLVTGIAQASISVLTVFGIYWVGRMAGGTGSFDQAMLTVIWLHFVLLNIEIGILVLGLFAPGLAMLLWVIGLVLTFWILSHFIAEMHGFNNAGMVFVGILLTMFAAMVVFSIVLAIIGVGVPTETGEF